MPNARLGALKRCAKICRRVRRDLSIQEVKDAGVGRGALYSQFGNVNNLNRAIRQEYPDYFDDVEIDLTNPTQTRAKKRLVNAKRLFVTTAVVGCKVNDTGFKTVTRMCEERGMELVVMICADSAATAYQTRTIDKRLKDAIIVTQDMHLNSNLYLNAIQIQAKQINPLTGLRRFAQDRGSFIAPSPKQFLLTAPRSQQKIPHIQITTGAITDSNYDSKFYNSKRTAKIADMDHVIGGVVVELCKKGRFHIRHVQIDKKGILVDLGIAWGPTSQEFVRADAVILGDRHNGALNKACNTATNRLLDTLKPHKTFVHDLCDFASISYHDRNKLSQRYRSYLAGRSLLKNELKLSVRDIENLASRSDEVLVVKSNHDEWLDKWIDTGAFVQDATNIDISVDVLKAKLNDQDALKTGLKLCGLDAKNVSFLTRDSDVRVGPFLCSAHGDLGVSGTKPGGPQGLERAFGSGVFGHSHTVHVWRGILQVGTSSDLKLSYNPGLVSWMHAHAAVWKTGHWQMYLIIDGKFSDNY